MSGGVLEISPEEARALLAGADAPRLIDCREEEEWEFCRLERAELLPLSTFAEGCRELLPDPEEKIVVYCHHGVRSLRAAEWLTAQGYSQVRSLSGGIDAWSRVIDPAVPRY